MNGSPADALAEIFNSRFSCRAFRLAKFLLKSSSASFDFRIVPEIQARYVTQLIDRIMDRGVAVEPCVDRTQEWVEAFREKAQRTVFGDGGRKG